MHRNRMAQASEIVTALQSRWKECPSSIERIEVCQSDPYTVVIATVKIRGWLHPVRQMGVAKRRPIDEPNPEVGIALAMRRALGCEHIKMESEPW